jgi:Sulfatase-modifying factor enzyme 1/Trypsin-like peptidase domain
MSLAGVAVRAQARLPPARSICLQSFSAMLSWTRHRCLPMLEMAALFLLAFGAAGRLWALDAAAMQAMVIVEGDVGRGSAFIVKMNGRMFLVTNSHVVRGNRNLKFKSLRNVELATGALEIADNVDAVRAEVSGVANTLELEPQVEKVKIGDEVIVAGNSEGEGVIREIPGKVVGIGPDRIEVDAEFVPGNSGSPILLKSTGKVIGVATYMKIPRGGRTGAKSPFSLNEVRRFGYRLDTVAKWIKPQGKDRLSLEGLKLAEMENLMSAIVSLLSSNAAFVTKWGGSGFVPKDKAQQYPAFAALAQAIGDFGKNQTTAKNDDEKAKNGAAFFAKIKEIVSEDVRGLNENQFSGFFAVQLKESLGRCNDFNEWCEGTTMLAYLESWLASRADARLATAGRSIAPPTDPAKLNLVLTDHIAPNEPADYCHHVTCTPETQPPNVESIFWIIENPKGERNAFPMHKIGIRVYTPVNGAYRVYAEYRGADKPRVISNVAEVKIVSAPAGQGANDVTVDQPALAAKGKSFVNSIGMKFVPVVITGGPTNGKRILFSVWDTRVQDYAGYAQAKGITPEMPRFQQGPAHPVVLVSWEDAKSFCEWLTAQERGSGKIGAGDQYRLPSDHEWSCAVGIGRVENAEESPESKSGKIAGYPWGTVWPPPKEAGNYGPALQVDQFEFTSPVASFAANENGLYDMGGNVSQWCEDWMDAKQTRRVFRGACWKESLELRSRSTFRFREQPMKRHDYIGFRCVLVISGGQAGL